MAILFNQGIQQANRIIVSMCTVSIAFDQYSKWYFDICLNIANGGYRDMLSGFTQYMFIKPLFKINNLKPIVTINSLSQTGWFVIRLSG